MDLSRGLVALAATLAAGLAVPAAAEITPHGAMLRYPDISSENIVFSYAQDIWLVPREGGVATPLASPVGGELFPRFSPDGQTIAYVANYDGNSDIYTLPITGGVPERITHHGALEFLTDWTETNQLVFHAWDLMGLSQQERLYTVSPTGGLPEALPVPYGADGTISADGEWLAYTPWGSRKFRTWKRHVGGQATDVWLFNLKDNTSRQITDWIGTDGQPMWHDGIVYYLSDAGEGYRYNIWSFDPKKDKREQLTDYTDYDVGFPAIGPGPKGRGEIVYQYGASLNVLDLKNGKTREVEITIPGDRPNLRPTLVDASDFIQGGSVSPAGERVAIEARGDIWSMPVEKGVARNLTRTDGAFERFPAWSPDGRWIAYFSDESGNYELTITQSDGKGETRTLTDLGDGFRFNPKWSPDSKFITYSDYAGNIFITTVEDGMTKVVDRDKGANRSHTSWSQDCAWFAYTKEQPNGNWAIYLYNMESEDSTKVTSGFYFDTWPTFDREGKYLYFASLREFTDPVYHYAGDGFVYPDTDKLVVVPLRNDVPSPWLPESDEVTWEEEKDEAAEVETEEAEAEEDEAEEAEEEGEEKEEEAEEEKPLEIDLEGFESRAMLLPVEKGGYFNLCVGDSGALFYTRNAEGEETKTFTINIEDDEPKAEAVADEGNFSMSADGKKLLFWRGSRAYVVDAKAGQSLKDSVSTKGMDVEIRPREEWHQIFTDVWRLYRDFFYDPGMHGVDWDGVYKQYEPMLADCVTRSDLNYIIREMIAELNVSHSYLGGSGDVERADRTSVGELGVDFTLENGAYRIAKIYEGGPWDLDARGPLSQPGVDVKEGDYLLAVNGVSLDTSMDPWASFQGIAGQTVTITVSEKPEIDDDAREVLVEPLRSDSDLRYRAWIELKRSYVDERTNGEVGYIYVPNTQIAGQNDLVRQLQMQRDKAALIIDERWNGGGQDPNRFVELLNRQVRSYRPSRYDDPPSTPRDAHFGPKCMLINGRAGSGGDLFPYYFRVAGVGKLIGTKTWGGVVGLTGNPELIDGGSITVPTRATYSAEGEWVIEGWGVEPDIRVVDDPAEMINGGDPQLDAAIDLMLKEIKENRYEKPPVPKYRDRSGMGRP
ncbi:PDZ domain-containing protein [bacterium]|nr:PDZ domain-containing protein [bacterium]